MAEGASYPDTGALPGEIPLFPLPGVLLLPGGQLPLNIFEPRYLNMTIDALGQGRIIGMIQPSPVAGETARDPDPRERPALYPAGCAGRIVSFSETGDGRLLITLLGLSRFRLAEELPMAKGYRRARVDYAPFADDLAASTPGAAAAVDRARLLRAADVFFKARGLNADAGSLDGAPDDLVVTTLAMVCPFDVREKQALLEAATLPARATLLTQLLEMAALGTAAAPDGTAH